MNRLKFAALAAAVAAMLIGAGAINAEQTASKGARHQKVRQGLDCAQAALNAAGVSDAQKADLKAIRDKYRPQFQDIKKSDIPKDEKIAKAKALGKEMKAEMAKVLTNEQRDAVKAYVKEHCPRHAKKVKQATQ